MTDDERAIALPKLYGAPAYARPPVVVTPAERPFDPDELPLAVHQTGDAHDEQAEHGAAIAVPPSGGD